MAAKRATGIILAVVLGLILIASGGVWAARGEIATGLLRRVLARNLTGDPVAALPDGLHVGLCGTGSPLPDPHRAGPCTLVIAGKRMFVVDTGEGAAKSMSLMGFMPARLNAAFITHYHSDHIDGLGAVLLQHWAGGAAQAPLPIYGPTGVTQVVDGFMTAYELDRGYRIAHHGPKVVPPQGFGGEPRPFEVTKGGGPVTLIDDADLKVTAFPVDHGPVWPAVGYKFVYKGRSVVISGDTAPAASVEAAAKGADLLVHEALSPTLVKMQEETARAAGRDNLAHVFHDIVGYHTSPEQAAEIAQRAGVKYLVLSHIVPALPVKALEGPFLGGARSKFSGTLRLGEDGDFFSLPAGSDAIETSKRSAMRP
ncbi:MBL fold metallo-hydrolase [Phenylobacterium sp.]|uniref:MBL fold metallo-hydrolase n=1 Tax=Phenylobacterium sp. TaxID=1871053 RepID=UPI0035AE815A